MKEQFKQFVDFFLFDLKKRRLSHILMAIFLLLFVFSSIYISVNADEIVDLPRGYIFEQNEKVGESASETVIDPVTGTPTKNSSKSKTNSNVSTSTPSNGQSSSGSSDGSTGEDGSGPSTLVAFYGDSQSDTDLEDQLHQNVVNWILGTSANPVFHAGDLLEDGTEASRDRFNNVTSTLRSTRSFYSAQGNNERNSSVYFDNFVFPGNEHWYSVNAGNLHMVILDNYASSTAVGSEQYNWLQADLQSSDSQSRITGVIFHYPIYGAGGDTKGMIPTVVSLFRNFGVDFVISGHEHIYQHSLVDGIHYFVTSGQQSLGYFLGSIGENSATISAYNSSNSLIATTSFNER